VNYLENMDFSMPEIQSYNLQVIVIRGWAGSLDDRKSITQNLFNFGSSAISWISKKQKTVSLPSTEAEYKAVSVG
jgi:hypothetical protein